MWWLLVTPSVLFTALCLCGAWRTTRKEKHMTYGDLLVWSKQAQPVCGDCGHVLTDDLCPVVPDGRTHAGPADLVRVIK